MCLRDPYRTYTTTLLICIISIDHAEATIYDETGCYSSMRSRTSTSENPCVDAGHVEIFDTDVCEAAVAEENTRRGASSPASYPVSEDYSFTPSGCYTGLASPTGDAASDTRLFSAAVNVNPNGAVSSSDTESVTHCCIPSGGCGSDCSGPSAATTTPSPTNLPTAVPTAIPSAAPSAVPSAAPTAVPSAAPT